jgi:DNA-binding IclR family transcriptional regulator
MRPAAEQDPLTNNERLVAYCVAISTHGPHPMGLNKIAQTSGMARTTTRRALKTLVEIGWVEKCADGTFLMSQEFSVGVVPMLEMERKFQAILRAADLLKAAGVELSPEEMSTGRGSETDSDAMDDVPLE